jgi:class I fructose-bisphosphate aldolase
MASVRGSAATTQHDPRPWSEASGKARRLARLRSPAGVYLWLALDHGLTRGVLDGLADVLPSLALTVDTAATGVVVNRGFAASLPVRARAGLVLQTFGLPATSGARDARVPTCRVEDALRLAADAVAVQQNLGCDQVSGGDHE